MLVAVITPETQKEITAPPPELVPPPLRRSQIKEIWQQCCTLVSPTEQQEFLESTYAPYIGGVFIAVWHDKYTPPLHAKKYILEGIEKDDEGGYHFILRNPAFDSYHPETRKALQRNSGVVYPRFPINYDTARHDGGPSDLIIHLAGVANQLPNVVIEVIPADDETELDLPVAV